MNTIIDIVERQPGTEEEREYYEIMMLDVEDHDFIALDCDTPHHMTHTQFLCHVKIVADVLHRSVPELGEYVIYETYRGFHVLYESIIHTSIKCDVITTLRSIEKTYSNVIDRAYVQHYIINTQSTLRVGCKYTFPDIMYIEGQEKIESLPYNSVIRIYERLLREYH